MTIIYLTVAWFAGLWLASRSLLEVEVWPAGAAIAAVAAIVFRAHFPTRLAWACLCTACLGGARYVAAVPEVGPAHVAYYNGRDVMLMGVVVDEPDVRDRRVLLRLKVQSVAAAGPPLPAGGVVQVSVPRFPDIPYGARLEVRGELEEPPQLEDFDYRAYLARQGVHSVMDWPEVTVLSEGHGNPLFRVLYAFKEQAHGVIQRILPEPEAALLSGILLGIDRTIPIEIMGDFRTTGAAHILIISGYNMTLLAAALDKFTVPLFGRRRANWTSLAGIGLYAVMVGLDVSVVRAALMSSLYIVSLRFLGRLAFAPASLFTAGLIMTLHDPFALWDVGFQLSFAATLGLMLYAEPFSLLVETRLKRFFSENITGRVMRPISAYILATLAAQVLTTPLIAAHFGRISLISPVVNALVLPVQPLVMIWGALATFSGLMIPVIGQVVAWVVWLPLAYTVGVIRLFAELPFAEVNVELTTIGVLFTFGLIFGATWWLQRPPDDKGRMANPLSPQQLMGVAIAASGIAAALVVAWGLSQPDGRLHVAFLDVGQGDAIFIQTPSGRQLLVDGGPSPTSLGQRLGEEMPFWDRTLDMVVATHPDGDHVNGLPALFDRYRVGLLVTNGQDDAPELRPLWAAAGDTPAHRATAGEVLIIDDGVRLEVLHPTDALSPESDNENSVSLRLVYGDFTLLLTGDAEREGENAMLRGGRPLQAIVFKAGHHGSNSSSSAPFLAAARPQVVVISAGADNRFGHPHPEMLARAAEAGAAVLRTDELGTIEVVTDGERMWWQTRP